MDNNTKTTRQYQILRKKEGSRGWATLEPGAHKFVYDKPEIDRAVSIMGQNPSIEAVCVRVDGVLFNIVSFRQQAVAPNAFVFPTFES